MDITAETERIIRELQHLVETPRHLGQADISGARPVVLQRATTILAELLEAHRAEAGHAQHDGSPAATTHLAQLIDELKTLRARAAKPPA